MASAPLGRDGARRDHVRRPDDASQYAAWVWPILVVYYRLLAVAWGVLFLAAGDEIAGKRRPLGELVRAATFRTPALLGTGMVAFVPVVFGTVLFVIPGVLLALAFPARAIDRNGPIESLRVSWATTRDSLPQLFAFVLLCGVVTSLNSSAVSAAFSGSSFEGDPATNVVQAVVAVIVPLFGLAGGHVYLENRRPEHAD